jgi:hypothetical protein
MKINVSNNESVIFALCGRIIMPLSEKIRSTGAEVAGVQNILSNRGCSSRYCLEVAAVFIVRVDSPGDCIACR